MPVRILRAAIASVTPRMLKIIRVPCSCRVNPMFILRAFQRGADGVIICGCHPGDCHYTSGNYYTRRRMALLFSMLDYLGIERERTRVEWVSAAEGAKFAATMNDFAEKVAALGRKQAIWRICDAANNPRLSYKQSKGAALNRRNRQQSSRLEKRRIRLRPYARCFHDSRTN